jgi:hypothetical protein
VAIGRGVEGAALEVRVERAPRATLLVVCLPSLLFLFFTFFRRQVESGVFLWEKEGRVVEVVLCWERRRVLTFVRVEGEGERVMGGKGRRK